MQATELRQHLSESLERVASDREPVEIRKHDRPVAILIPSPDLPPNRRKPPIDLDAIAKFCRKHAIKSFALFGSILRDDFCESSDVDVLVDLPGMGLDFHVECRMLDELEIIFGRKVDLVYKDILASPLMNKHRKISILESAQEVYRAS